MSLQGVQRYRFTLEKVPEVGVSAEEGVSEGGGRMKETEMHGIQMATLQDTTILRSCKNICNYSIKNYYLTT